MTNRKPRPAAVTLKDLAAELGLHPSTVSRILHAEGDTARGAAAPATAQRVRDLARAVGYSPDPQAKSLRTRQTHLLGVIVPRLSDLVLAVMYEGIEEAADAAGYSTFVMNSLDNAEMQRRKTDIMLSRRVDGLIFGDAHLDGDILTELAEQNVKFVLMNRAVQGFPSATCDDALGGTLVAQHLWDRGHRVVSVIAGEPYASTAVDRTSGFVTRWKALGGEIPEAALVWSRFDTIGGRIAAETILSDVAHKPSAIFAVNDFAAIGAMGAATEHGLLVGRDLAIVGFNDTSLAAQLPISLSSVRSPMTEIGRTAVQMLLATINGGPVESVRLAPTLVVRESSAFQRT
ncbi:LacI family transcriptional regulator [Cryobacterium roopkundense]|uniref:LacI family transcriptional regulator n=1 Tax=Cryobacterium roopkundense TaxID=1001240 RepID=A0A099JJD5_9MICO|nr:substrate-binding domain-containing protein [Cryobacterium roopkundense]KGJ77578.1 LacI family transcriptional regulator [Cryobacterium roopkundense]MBB5641707.1 LacI family transcriptional regulator [Cryobacterium roopkundense]